MNQEIAVLLAAGLGSRMRPLTEKIPKPLVCVKGVPLIETMIQGLLARKVSRIYIVVGYKKEMFDYLSVKYEEVILVENEEYLEKNNISSLYTVKDFLGENPCFICEADIYVQNRDIFLQELRTSVYYAKMKQGYSDDWIFETKGKRITQIKKGGTDVYNMTGVAYLKMEDVRVLKRQIEKIYAYPGHEKLFWDEVVDQILGRVEIVIHEISSNDLIEVDTIAELALLDESYRGWENICD